MSETPDIEVKPLPSSYVVLLSGTHVVGKDTLAISLAKALNCQWISGGDMAYSSARFGSLSQEKMGYDYNKVFGRIWWSKLERLGFLTHVNEPEGESKAEVPRKLGTEGCTAILTVLHMRKVARDAIRDVMLAHSIRPIFVIMHITKETLSGRTLGAEEPELAKRIMATKMADIEEPLEEEMDTILIDSLQNVNDLFQETLERITALIQMNK